VSPWQGLVAPSTGGCALLAPGYYLSSFQDSKNIVRTHAVLALLSWVEGDVLELEPRVRASLKLKILYLRQCKLIEYEVR